MPSERKIFEIKATALRASFVGFFRAEPPKNGAKCQHNMCIPIRGTRAAKWECHRTRYRRYTRAQLAAPDTRPDAAAIRILLQSLENWGHGHDEVVLYDLLQDRWVTDSWYRLCAPQNELLTPMADMGIEIIPPDQIANINDVLSAMKDTI